MVTHVEFPAFGTYGFLAVRRPNALDRALRIARTVVDDVDDDVQPVPARRRPRPRQPRTRPVGRGRPAAGRGRAGRGRGRGARRTGWCTPAGRGHWSTLGYDRDFRELRGAGTEPADATASTDGRRLARVGRAGDARCGSRPAPRSTSAPPRRRGRPTSSPRRSGSELGAPALVSLGGDISIAAPDGVPWQVAVAEHPGEARATGRLVTLTAAASPRRAPACGAGPRGVRRHHLLDPRTGEPATEVWRTVTATGPTCAAANTATHGGRRARRRGAAPGSTDAASPPASSPPTAACTPPAAGPTPRGGRDDRGSAALVPQPRHRLGADGRCSR